MHGQALSRFLTRIGLLRETTWRAVASQRNSNRHRAGELIPASHRLNDLPQPNVGFCVTRLDFYVVYSAPFRRSYRP